jgi:hypothetical protein
MPAGRGKNLSLKTPSHVVHGGLSGLLVGEGLDVSVTLHPRNTPMSAQQHPKDSDRLAPLRSSL